MKTRREFLREITVTLLLVPIAASACASASSGAAAGADDGCNGLDPTSTVTLGHTHTVCIPQSDLANPPAGGATYTTSAPTPMHTVTLTQAQLESIQAGQAVTVTTSVANNHTHNFNVQSAT
jgi:hypothetical protein